MIDNIKNFFKLKLPIPIIYTIIIIFYLTLIDSQDSDYIVEFLISHLFHSYKILKFIDLLNANIVRVFWVILACIDNDTITKDNVYLHIILNNFRSLTLYISALKLFTYFLINYKTDIFINLKKILIVIMAIAALYIIFNFILKKIYGNK